MKAIRRSLKNDKERESKHARHNSLHQKAPSAIIPPKKVIKALYDYQPANKNGEELAFHRGDFFHVIGREDDTEWYEACNPLIPSAKGLVPVAFFEIIGKQQRQSGQSVRTSDGHDSGFSEKGLSAGLHEKAESPPAPRPNMHARGPSAAKASAMVYGVVQYDFQAERPDELDARASESIIVVAQSNPEWFVAKPIGRLGGPGLIPVSFIKIIDLTTGQPAEDPLAAVRAAGVPRVEEWKRTAAEYKNSSISLGQINTPQIGGVNSMTQGMDRLGLQRQKQPQMQQIKPLPPAASQSSRQLLVPVQASVPRYCFDNDMYWYIIECQMEDGRWWELSRYYADFYDLQIALIEKFPEEAGNTGKQRTLPYMPGPVAHVTDAISNGRRQNLDEYIKQIVAMPDHIREDVLVRRLFAPKDSDFEMDPNALNDDYRLSGHSLAPTQSRHSSGAGSQNQSSAYVPMPPPSTSTRNGHQKRPSFGQHPNGSSSATSMPPPLHSQPSNLTQNSADTTNSTGNRGPPAPGGALRAKIEFNNDIRTIRIQQNISLKELHEKVRERLLINEAHEIRMRYRDDQMGTVVPLESKEDLDDAIRRNANLRIVVEFAE